MMSITVRLSRSIRWAVGGDSVAGDRSTVRNTVVLPVSYLGDDEGLSVLQAALQGEAPRRSSLQPGLHQHPAAAAASSSSARRLPEPRPAAALHARRRSAQSGLRCPQPGRGPAERTEEKDLCFTSAFPSFI